MNLLTPDEVAAKLRISKAALPGFRRREKSFPPPVRVSNRVLRWDNEEIETWLENRKETTHHAQN